MVKFDIDVFKFLNKEHFRVLTAIEMGMKNHELVPTALIESISNMKRGNCYSIIKDLHKHKLVVHNSIPYDGYHLTYRGYDYLAIRAFVMKGIIIAIGKQIGIGKESDVYEAFDANRNKIVIKLHRLGRISFRKVKEKRDYIKKGSSVSKKSWLYMSRLSALKEYSFMKVLYSRGFPVPKAIDVCRHAILMSYVKGYPLYHVKKIRKPAIIYNKCMQLIVLLAKNGLIHCDFNEFNLIVTDKYDLILIDFPQMVSIQHSNSIELFNRDVKCIVNFFDKKYNYSNAEYPIMDEKFINTQVETHLDSVVKASGFDIDNIDIFANNDHQSENDNDNENDNEANIGNNDKKDDDDMKENKDSENNRKIENSKTKNANRMNEKEEQLRKDNPNVLCKDNDISSNIAIKNKDDDEKNLEINANDDDNDDNTGNNDDDDDEEEEEADEKLRWQRKKLEKRRKFEERRRIKQKFKQRQEEMLNGSQDDALNNGKNNSKDGKFEFLSAEEIRKRVKKKQKSDERKQKYRRAKKTGQRNKDVQALKKELKNDFWG